MIRSITLALAAIIILSSCGNKFSLVKRKYTKGYYVSGTKSRHTTAKNTAIAKHPVKQQLPATEKVSKPPVETVYNRVENEPVFVKPNVTDETITLKEKKQPEKAVTAFASTRPGNHFSKKTTLALKPLVLLGVTNASSANDDDAMFIVLVILCFFWWLNLISVYIHDGKKVTTNFWVTLLLNFTFIGGIIFALLVVLDVVDLK